VFYSDTVQLSETETQHSTTKADTPDLDDAESNFGYSRIAQFTEIVDLAMNPTCAANVVSLLCHAVFKECQQVVPVTPPTAASADNIDSETTELLWLPSLLCRSECDRHLAIWNECVNEISEDPEAKKSFDTQMLALVNMFMLIILSFHRA
jgi:hypothetical protein